MRIIAIEGLTPNEEKRLIKAFLDNNRYVFINTPLTKAFTVLSFGYEDRVFVVFRWLYSEACLYSHDLFNQTQWCPLGRVLRHLGFRWIAIRPASEASNPYSAAGFYFGILDTPVLYYRTVDDIIYTLSQHLDDMFNMNFGKENGDEHDDGFALY